MLPRLEAQEQLAAIQAVLAGGGRMIEDRQQMIMLSELETQANGGRRVRRATAETMANMSVPVIDEDDEQEGGEK
jgi:hypothetical protein